jgi:hypothetical protein
MSKAASALPLPTAKLDTPTLVAWLTEKGLGALAPVIEEHEVTGAFALSRPAPATLRLRHLGPLLGHPCACWAGEGGTSELLCCCLSAGQTTRVPPKLPRPRPGPAAAQRGRAQDHAQDLQAAGCRESNAVRACTLPVPVFGSKRAQPQPDARARRPAPQAAKLKTLASSGNTVPELAQPRILEPMTGAYPAVGRPKVRGALGW